MTQASMAVRPSAFGELVWIVLNMLTSTRKMVTKRVIRPGMTSEKKYDLLTGLPNAHAPLRKSRGATYVSRWCPCLDMDNQRANHVAKGPKGPWYSNLCCQLHFIIIQLHSRP